MSINWLLFLSLFSFKQSRLEAHDLKIACSQLQIGRGIFRVKREPRTFSQVSFFYQTLVSHCLKGMRVFLPSLHIYNLRLPFLLCAGVSFFMNVTLFTVQVCCFPISSAILIFSVFPLCLLFFTYVCTGCDLEAFFC